MFTSEETRRFSATGMKTLKKMRMMLCRIGPTCLRRPIMFRREQRPSALVCRNTLILATTLEICPSAGHTPGMVTVLLPEERKLLLGDACNPFTFPFDSNSSSVKPIGSFRGAGGPNNGRYDRVSIPWSFINSAEMIDSVIQVCDDIMAGQTDDLPFQFLHQPLRTMPSPKPTAKAGVFSRVDGVWARCL